MRSVWGLLAALIGAVGLGIVFAVVPWLAGGGEMEIGGRDSPPAEAPGLSAPLAGPAPGSCSLCQPLDDLREAFSRRAEGAAHRIAALEDALNERRLAGREGNAVASSIVVPLGTLEADLAAATRAREAALAAVARLDIWRHACRADAVCVKERQSQAPVAGVAGVCPAPPAGARRQALAARQLAAEIGAASAACAARACPSLGCAAATALREEALAMIVVLRVLGAGASDSDADSATTAVLRAAAVRTVEDVRYASRLFPMLFDEASGQSTQDVVKLSRDLIGAQRNAILTLLVDAPADPSAPAAARELHQRLAALRLDLDSLDEWSAVALKAGSGADAEIAHWVRLADDLGAALMATATLQTAIGTLPPAPLAGCADAAEYRAALAELQAAVAALDMCRRKGGCADPAGTDGARAADTVAAKLEPSPGGGERARARVLLDELMAATRRHAKGLRLPPDPAVLVSAGRASVTAGEPLRLRLRLPDAACLTGAAPAFRLRDAAGQVSRIAARRDPLDADPEALYLGPFAPGVYDIEVTTPAARGAAPLASVNVAVRPPEMCAGFAGRWRSNAGLITLSVRGRDVTGTIQGRDPSEVTLIVGSIHGEVLRGRWIGEGTSGGVRLTLGSGGASFAGTWGTTPAETSNGGSWTGTCLAPEGP